MIVKVVKVGMLQTNCVIVGDPSTNECAVFDPGAASARILEAIAQTGMTLTQIVLTHGHFDHVLAAPALKQASGARLLIHKNDEWMLDDKVVAHMAHRKEPYERPLVDGYLEDGQTFMLGSIPCTVLNTKGHSEGSCVFLIGELMLAGDTLFFESCGRCDLEGGSEAEMEDSLRRLAALPGDYRVICGHERETTLSHERAHNPYMRGAVSP